ncbi:MAG: serine/threonine-protein kinase, partial [Coriobacteriales bacterium]
MAKTGELIGGLIGGRYKVLTQVGEGGMSRVYLALDTILNKQWAAKEIKLVEDRAQRDLVVNSLITESNMIKRLDHPAIPRIVDIVDEQGALFVIMDYIEGHTLEDILENEGRQSEDDVVDWAIQLCDVLDYLHEHNPRVIYRDMKPSNVMLKPNGMIQLIDFGIAREYREDGEEVTAAVGDTVQLGTRGFAPPEQYGGAGQTDARSDIYALGATMSYLITGQNPAEPPYTMPPLRQVVPEVSPGLERIVTRATQNDPDARYQSAASLAYDLEHYREEDEAHTRRLRRKWNTFLGLVISAAACLVLGFGFLAGQHVAIGSDYNHWMEVGRQSSDHDEAADAFVRAAAIKPGTAEPYLELADVYRADQDFTVSEERQLRESLLPQLTAFKHDAAYAELTFSLGKLYWYDYSAGGSAVDYENGRYERIRAASQWMNDAASVEDFSGRNLAQSYADIADFNTRIVPLINEGTDSGAYAPYFDKLGELLDSLGSEDNDVMKLEAASLVLDSIRTYPRKFRADGVTQDQLYALVDKAYALSNSVYPTTDRLDSEKEHVGTATSAARGAVSEAFIHGRRQPLGRGQPQNRGGLVSETLGVLSVLGISLGVVLAAISAIYF